MIPLTLIRARSIPEDIGDAPDSPTFDGWSIVMKYRIDEIPVAVGTLTVD